MLKRTFLNRQFLVYVAGGVLSALVDIGLLRLLLAYHVALLAATSAAFLAGLLVNYSFHANLTFRERGAPGAFGCYLCVVGGNYLATLACVGAAELLLGAPMIGKVLALPLVAAIGYVAGKHWIFKPH